MKNFKNTLKQAGNLSMSFKVAAGGFLAATAATATVIMTSNVLLGIAAVGLPAVIALNLLKPEENPSPAPKSNNVGPRV